MPPFRRRYFSVFPPTAVGPQSDLCRTYVGHTTARRLIYSVLILFEYCNHADYQPFSLFSRVVFGRWRPRSHGDRTQGCWRRMAAPTASVASRTMGFSCLPLREIHKSCKSPRSAQFTVINGTFTVINVQTRRPFRFIIFFVWRLVVFGCLYFLGSLHVMMGAQACFFRRVSGAGGQGEVFLRIIY